MEVGVVGPRGELLPPKKIRDMLGLKPGTKVVYWVKDNKLMVEAVPRLEDLLRRNPVIEITLDEFHRFRKKFSEKIG